MATPPSERIHGAVQAVVRHALGRGYLSGDSLREALLLQHQLNQSGQQVDLLHLLSARYLEASWIPELTAVYQQAVAGAAAGSGEASGTILQRREVPVDPTLELKSSQLVKRPRAEDPGWVQQFLNESGEGSRPPVEDSVSATVGLPSGSGPHLGPGIPERIGDYRIVRELARGGFGVVCQAYSISLDRAVALKLMRDAAFADLDDVGRFLTEARAAARLRHPGIVGVFEVGEEAGHRFIAMELIRGESLRARLEREGPMEPREAAAILRSVAQALDYAHEEGILHRDIKPGNILLDERGQPHLTDFGLAKDVRSGTGPTVTGEILGTPAYMPPEQTRGRMELVDERSDVYSLGATLYRMVCGRAPFEGKTALGILEDVARASPTRPSALVRLPGDLETILLTCMERIPSDRYASAEALADDLGRFLAGEVIAASPPGPLGRLWRWVQRKPAAAVTIVAVLLALTGVGGVAYRWGRGEAEAAKSQVDAEARLARCAGVLDRVAAGEVSGPDEEEDALVVLTSREDGVDVVPLLVERLNGVSSASWSVITQVLEEGAQVTSSEASAGAVAVEGVPQAVAAWRRRPPGQEVEPGARRVIRRSGERVERRQRTADLTRQAHPRVEMIWTQRQSKQVGHRLAEAGILCRALGRLADPRAVAALGDYLRAEHDPSRAQVPALALCRTGGFQAYRYVEEALRRFGEGSSFRLPVAKAFGRLRDSLPPAKTFEDMLVRGRGRLITREWKAAAEDAARAIELAYDDPRGWVLRAEARYSLRDLAGAKEDAKRAILVDADHARAWVVRGFVARRARRWVEAERCLTKAIELEPTDAQAWATRGEVRSLLGRLDAAMADAEHAIRLQPQGLDGLRSRAVIRFLRRDLDGAQSDFGMVLKLQPDSLDMRIYMAKIKHALKDPRGALTFANYAVERAKGRQLSDALAARGAILSEGGAIEPAVQDLERATRLNSENYEAWMYLGVARARLHKTAQARSALDLAVKLNPTDALTRANRAAVHKQAGNVEAALKDLDEALRLDPTQTFALALRGELRAKAGRAEEGIADLERAVARAPREGSYWLWLGDARKAAGRSAAARAAFERAIEVEPGRVEGWSRLLIVLHHQDRAQALKVADRAVRAVPHAATVWRMRGTLRAKAKRLTEAESDLGEALQRDPSDLEAWAARGGVRSLLGKRALAEKDLARAVAKNPRSAPLWMSRARIRAVVGDLMGALRDYEAIEPLCADAERPRLWFERGEMRLGTRANLKGAKADMNRYLATRPTGQFAQKARRYLALLARMGQ